MLREMNLFCPGMGKMQCACVTEALNSILKTISIFCGVESGQLGLVRFRSSWGHLVTRRLQKPPVEPPGPPGLTTHR